ncbi:hypothetical protein, partial [Paracoccus versutus]|uniref:hypothetical protein n=1 Tax=Paracoccus versutus TaxID=34007 RepID=UPI001C690A06
GAPLRKAAGLHGQFHHVAGAKAIKAGTSQRVCGHSERRDRGKSAMVMVPPQGAASGQMKQATNRKTSLRFCYI